MSKYNNIYDVNEWSAEVIEMKAQGFATRHIARSLFDRESYRNRLNAYFKREDVAEQIEKRQQEIEFAKCVDPLIFKCAFENDYTDWEKKEKPSLGEVKKKPTILIIADTQVKPTESLEYILWVGKYIHDTKPDIILMIGDWWDFPSLSSYDKGKASSEGRRFVDDLTAGNKGLELLELEINKDPSYKPRKVFCKGNHEHRVDRYVEDNPELKGTLGTEFLPLTKYGWEVYDFLVPVEIEGIFFVHYLANPMTGKPYSGTASNILKTVGRSFVVGHKQVLDIAIRPTFDGKQQIGIVNGACLTPDHKVLTDDLKYVPLGEVKVGQKVVSVDEFAKDDSHRRFKTGEVIAHKIEKDIVYKVTLSDGTTFKVTDDHKWLVKTGSMYLWKETNQLRKGTRVTKALDMWETLETFEAGWLSGIYDGEGTYGVRKSGNSVCAQMSLCQKQGLVLDKIEATMKSLNLVPNYSVAKGRDVVEVKVQGGVRNIAKTLGALRPVRLLSKFRPEHLGRLKTTDSENPSVVSIEKLGEMDVVRIHVDEATMIVDGFVHHNCYPFNEGYKGYFGNVHYRGVTILTEVSDGFGLPSFVSLDRMKELYYA